MIPKELFKPNFYNKNTNNSLRKRKATDGHKKRPKQLAKVFQ